MVSNGVRRWVARMALGAVALACFTGAAQAALEISSKATSNVTCSGGVCTATAKDAVLNVSDLAGMLSAGDVTVASGSLAKDISIDASLRWVSPGRLTLDAYHSINFNKAVDVAGTSGLTITTNDGGSNGDFRFFGKGHVEFKDLHSSLFINGDQYALADSLKLLNTYGKNVQHFALAKSITPGKTYRQAPIDIVGGTFEGLGNTITGLTITTISGDEPVGLIRNVDVHAVIRDIGLPAVNINTRINNAVGALVGPGGFALIVHCYATGNITANGATELGGLVGFGAFIVESHANVAVSNSVAVGDVGGLVGNGSDISESYATGAVTGGDKQNVGGLAGLDIDATVLDSYATGPVTGGDGASVGGLIGTYAFQQDGQISASYSTGAVNGGSASIAGGLIGQAINNPTISNTYWDLETSGISDPSQGAGNVPNEPGITGLTTAQFQSGLPAGFDKSVWGQKSKINGGFPYLLVQPPPK